MKFLYFLQIPSFFLVSLLMIRQLGQTVSLNFIFCFIINTLRGVSRNFEDGFKILETYWQKLWIEDPKKPPHPTYTPASTSRNCKIFTTQFYSCLLFDYILLKQRVVMLWLGISLLICLVINLINVWKFFESECECFKIDWRMRLLMLH